MMMERHKRRNLLQNESKLPHILEKSQNEINKILKNLKKNMKKIPKNIVENLPRDRLRRPRRSLMMDNSRPNILPKFKSLDHKHLYKNYPEAGKAKKNLKTYIYAKNSEKKNLFKIQKNKKIASKKNFFIIKETEEVNSARKSRLEKTVPIQETIQKKSKTSRIGERSLRNPLKKLKIRKSKVLSLYQRRKKIKKLLKDPLTRYVYDAKKRMNKIRKRDEKKGNMRWRDLFCICKKSKVVQRMKGFDHGIDYV